VRLPSLITLAVAATLLCSAQAGAAADAPRWDAMPAVDGQAPPLDLPSPVADTRLLAAADRGVEALPPVAADERSVWSSFADDGRGGAAPPSFVDALPQADSPGRLAVRRVFRDYRNFYACDSLLCLTAALGTAAIMANTGFDSTMQDAWQEGVEPTSLGTFFVGCKDIGDGRYALPIYGAAAAAGWVFDGCLADDIVGEWGSRSLRMFTVGAPPLYALQWATGAGRPGENVRGSRWNPFDDVNGVSGHAFMGALPFLAAADMVESPLLKGTLYVCSTFVGFSRMTTNSHYPSQVFMGWYIAWASSRAVSQTELQFGRTTVRFVPMAAGDAPGMGMEAAW
jgi:membrane-associated phospholipid phosphatase